MVVGTVEGTLALWLMSLGALSMAQLLHSLLHSKRHPFQALPEQNGNTTERAVGLMHTFVMMIKVGIDSEYILLTRRGIQNHQKHSSYLSFGNPKATCHGCLLRRR